MYQVSVEVPYVRPRNRATTAVRIILAIPHLVIASAWGSLIRLIAIVQWFIIVFTGKRNQALFDFSNLWLAYNTRTVTYAGLLFDEFPAFAFTADGANTPLRYSMGYDEASNRLTNGLRLIWAIPAFLIGILLGIAGFFVSIAAWFAILVTGAMPDSFFGFLLKVHRYWAQLNAYLHLMTDQYPKYA